MFLVLLLTSRRQTSHSMRAVAGLVVALSLLGAAQAQSASDIFPELLSALTGGSQGTSSQAYLYSVASELATGFENSLQVLCVQAHRPAWPGQQG